MRGRRMQYVALAAYIAILCCQGCAPGGARTPEPTARRRSTTAAPDEQYVRAIAEIKELVKAGESAAAKEIVKQLKEEFPDQVGPDLDVFVAGELHYWADRYGKALVKYEKLMKHYPGSEFAELVQEREYNIAAAYLQGRKKKILGFIKISGYAEGVAVMDKISDRAGLDEPNGVGLRAAIAVAEHYERTEQYLDAYLKWSEIASYWESGPIGKRAIFRMAEDNLAAYHAHSPDERHVFDASKLTTARTYYERFLALYPEEAAKKDVPEKIRLIDEQMAYKQLKIAQYYRRTGKHRAAYLYFDMIIQNWPDTEAAETARHEIAEHMDGGPTSGK